MAFPTVSDVTRGNDNTNGATSTLTLPATVNAGDLLLAIVVKDSWSQLNWDHTSVGAWRLAMDHQESGQVRLAAFWKIADGTEDCATLTIAFDSSEKCAWQIYRITGANFVECNAEHASGVSTAPDPTSLSPSWGSADTLWIAAAGVDANSVGSWTAPSGYSSGILDRANSTTGVSLLSAVKTATAASEDPGAFSIAASEQWAATIFAVGTRTDFPITPHVSDFLTDDGSGPVDLTSTSFTPVANALLVAAVSVIKDGTSPEDALTVTGGGLSWTRRKAVSEAGTGVTSTIEIWTAPVGSSPSSMTINVAGPAQTSAAHGSIQAFSFEGYDTASPVGATASGTALGQVAASITLDASPATTSYVVAARAFFDAATNNGGTAPGGNYFEIFDRADGNGAGCQAVMYRTASTSTSVDWDDIAEGGSVSADTCIAVAVELKINTATPGE